MGYIVNWVDPFPEDVREPQPATQPAAPSILELRERESRARRPTPTPVVPSEVTLSLPAPISGLRRSALGLPARRLTAHQFGVEIECLTDSGWREIRDRLSEDGVPAVVVGGDGRGWDPNRWTVKGDGSLSSSDWNDGVEVVSPPIRELGQVEKVCSVLSDLECGVNRTCGLHVHFNARDMTFDTIKRVVMAYACFEPAIDTFMPESRRRNNNSYAQSMASCSPDGYPGLVRSFNRTGCNNVRNLASIWSDSRYWKVNLQAYFRHGTIEFRHHSGTINAKKITRWIEVLDLLILFAERDGALPAQQVTTPEEMFSILEGAFSGGPSKCSYLLRAAGARPDSATRRAFNLAASSLAERKPIAELRRLAAEAKVPWRTLRAEVRRLLEEMQAQGLPDLQRLREHYINREEALAS
jgi:hypothetical protein